MFQIKHMGRKNKGKEARVTVGVKSSGSANKECEKHGHEGEKGRENEGESASGRWGKREIEGERKTVV